MSDRMKDYMDAAGEAWTGLLNPRIRELGRRSDWRLVEEDRITDLGALVGLTDIELDASILQTKEGKPDYEAMRRTVRDAVEINSARGTDLRVNEFLKGLRLSIRTYPLYTRDNLRHIRRFIPEMGLWQSRWTDLVITLDRVLGKNGRVVDNDFWNYLHSNVEANRPLSTPIAYHFEVKTRVGRDLATHSVPAIDLLYRKTPEWTPSFDANGNPLPYTFDWQPTALKTDTGRKALEPVTQPVMMQAAFSSVADLNLTQISEVTGSVYLVQVKRERVGSHYVYTVSIPPEVDLDWLVQGLYLFDLVGKAFYLSTFGPIQKVRGFGLTFEVSLPRLGDVVIPAPVVAVSQNVFVDAQTGHVDWTWTRVDGETGSGVATLQTYEVSTDGIKWYPVSFKAEDAVVYRTTGTPGGEVTLHVRAVTSENTVGTMGTATATYALA